MLVYEHSVRQHKLLAMRRTDWLLRVPNWCYTNNKPAYSLLYWYTTYCCLLWPGLLWEQIYADCDLDDLDADAADALLVEQWGIGVDRLGLKDIVDGVCLLVDVSILFGFEGWSESASIFISCSFEIVARSSRGTIFLWTSVIAVRTNCYITYSCYLPFIIIYHIPLRPSCDSHKSLSIMYGIN